MRANFNVSSSGMTVPRDGSRQNMYGLKKTNTSSPEESPPMTRNENFDFELAGTTNGISRINQMQFICNFLKMEQVYIFVGNREEERQQSFVPFTTVENRMKMTECNGEVDQYNDSVDS
jgi:hypothetical protein